MQSEEKGACIDFFYKRLEGESAKKLQKRMDNVFDSITESTARALRHRDY